METKQPTFNGVPSGGMPRATLQLETWRTSRQNTQQSVTIYRNPRRLPRFTVTRCHRQQLGTLRGTRRTPESRTAGCVQTFQLRHAVPVLFSDPFIYRATVRREPRKRVYAPYQREAIGSIRKMDPRKVRLAFVYQAADPF